MSQLARQRRAMGLTQHQLSRGARVPRWKITFAETGRTKLTDAEVARIEQVFTARAKEIAGMVDDPVYVLRRSMRRGEHVVVIRGPNRGRLGSIRRRTRAGKLIVNLLSTHGLPESVSLRASELRRVQATPKADRK